MSRSSKFLMSIGIRGRVLAIAVLPVFFLSILLGYHIIDIRIADNSRALNEKGRLLVKQLAMASELPLFAGNSDRIQQIVAELSDNPEVEWGAVFDSEGRLVAASERFDLIEYQVANNQITPKSQFILAIGTGQSAITDFEAEEGGFSGSIGRAVVSLSVSEAEAERVRIVSISVLIILTSLLLILPIAVFLSRSIFSPIQRMNNAIKALRSGNKLTRVAEEGFGELGQLEQQFNEMAETIERNKWVQEERIASATAKLKRTVAQLEDRNRKLVEAQTAAEKASQAKAEFLARMSHEIRTPLNAVVGFSHILKRNPGGPDQTDLLDTINLSSRHLLTLVDDILSFSRLESDSIELETLDFDLPSMLEGVVSMFSPMAHEKELEFALLLHSDLPSRISGDPKRLTQIITNLASNALKFTQQGYVFIEAELIQNATGSVVEISIKDTGIGLDADEISRLFQPFSQADSSISRRYGGSGLGLYISKRLVDLMQGDLRIESRKNRGSCFTVSLPTKTDVELTSGEFRGLEGRSVLIYDKKPITRRCLRTMTASWGMRVVNMANLDTVIEAFSTSGSPAFDILLLSLDDSERKSAEIEAIYNRCREHYLGPVLMLVDLYDWQLPRSVYQDKAWRWISKPVRRSILFQKISSAIGITAEDGSTVTARYRTVESSVESNFKTLLIVDDQQINRQLIRQYLLGAHLKILEAENGTEAIQLASDNQIDLIFMDIHMPDMTGIEAAKQIRELKTDESLYIVSLTADVFVSSHDDEENRIDSVFDHHLLKPVMEEDIKGAIKRFLVLDERNEHELSTASASEIVVEFTERVRIELYTLVDEAEGCLFQENWEGVVSVLHKLRGVVGLYQIRQINEKLEEIAVLVDKKQSHETRKKLVEIRAFIS